MKPEVSFIVPCYNLGHLLAECVESILAQTYGDFELLIMDDCSPDQTPEVARSFRDPRVQHIRNERNLGHIANYNKAIGRARGRYVWLISADDRLGRSYVLERYVRLLDAHPEVGYVFCPAIRLEDDREAGVMEFSAAGPRDAVLPGREFLQELVKYNIVQAPTAMARRECYERVSLFPADLPYSGDWFLWCAFGLHYDVGYFAEPMVYRRYHARNISNYFWNDAVHVYVGNQIEVPWRMRRRAEALGYGAVVESARQAIVAEYVRAIAEVKVPMSLAEFADSLTRHARDAAEARGLRAAVRAGLGDHHYWRGDFGEALAHYGAAVREDPWRVRTLAKYALLRAGTAGVRARELVSALRRRARGARAA